MLKLQISVTFTNLSCFFMYSLYFQLDPSRSNSSMISILSLPDRLTVEWSNVSVMEPAEHPNKGSFTFQVGSVILAVMSWSQRRPTTNSTKHCELHLSDDRERCCRRNEMVKKRFVDLIKSIKGKKSYERDNGEIMTRKI